MKIYHNSRCSKSRQGLDLLKDSEQDFEIINYLETNPQKEEIQNLLSMLGMEKPIDLIRKTEAIWKENFKGKDLSDDEIIEAMTQNPRLIERPIVVKGNKAVIGRPLENIEALLKGE